METILRAVDEFAARMKEHGYDSAFLAEAGYPGNLKECLLNYMEQSILGNEKGVKDGISLSTYLRWEGGDQDYIKAWMYVRLVGDKFHTTKMSLTAGSANVELRKLDLELNGKLVPTRAEAIAAIDPTKQKLKKKKGYKL